LRLGTCRASAGTRPFVNRERKQGSICAIR
jgi:hypothetical protein